MLRGSQDGVIRIWTRDSSRFLLIDFIPFIHSLTRSLILNNCFSFYWLLFLFDLKWIMICLVHFLQMNFKNMNGGLLHVQSPKGLWYNKSTIRYIFHALLLSFIISHSFGLYRLQLIYVLLFFLCFILCYCVMAMN